MDISIIIPIYNEEKNVSPLSAEIDDVMKKLGKSYEIIFVNDGSTDDSLKEILAAKKRTPAIKIITLRRNFGQTAAVMAGFHSAKGAVIITMDGDMQNDPHDIPILLDRLNAGFDIVSGWRRVRKDPYLKRVLPSKMANWIIAKTLKMPLHDFGCTLKAYKREAVKDINLYGEMHRFIPVIAAWKGFRATEVEVNHRKRLSGKAKYGINRTIKVMLDLLLLVFLSGYSTKPIRFFGGVGLISGLVGLILFVMLVSMKIIQHVDMTGNPLLILSAMFFIMSAQFISMGFLGEINIRTYYESQNKRIYHISEIIE